MSDNVMYDSPTEFLHDVASSGGACVAQSVIPTDHGTYRCACSCEQWQITTTSRDEGLHQARIHTGNAT
jgi:hypothetical protein